MIELRALTPDETEQALSSHRLGKTESTIGKIADALMDVVDTEGSVFVAGRLPESTINSLRTRMYRKNVVITVRTIKTGDTPGHIILAKRIEEG
jgi:hypothetical protein